MHDTSDTVAPTRRPTQSHRAARPKRTSRRHDPRFGFRAPRDGSPAPFRVLISSRWTLAGAVSALLALLGYLFLPPYWRVRLIGAAVGAAGTAFGLATLQASRLTFERVTLEVPHLPAALDGLTIAQLSDMHIGSRFSARAVRRAIAWVRQIQPDLVVLTGDYASFPHDIALLNEALEGIAAKRGVYAILGNHDYWIDVALIEQVLTGHGIELLRNDWRRFEINGASFYLVGIDCLWEAQHDLEQALAGLPQNALTVVLAHEPDIADDVARYNVTLQLSGHTHAGHIAAPLLGPFFLPRYGFRYVRGLYQVGEMWLYVSQGLGGIPLRIGSTPEATLFTLRQASSST